MTYQEAVRYILDIPRFTRKNDLDHTRTFLRYLGDPQEAMKIIHVAGTNGKGSVCAYLDAMLRTEGQDTGLFTSPHLVRINERIRINGEILSDEAFTELFRQTMDTVNRMEKDGLSHPTFFEFLFAMALLAFREAGVDYAVLETGLGGRLDATSAADHPEICVITSIGRDHIEYLGDTLEEIAGEKAGIIRPGVPVLFAPSSPESDKVIADTAAEQHCFCKIIGKDAYEILGIRDKHIAFSCSNAYYGNTTWQLNNTGTYQPGNAMLAMETMRYLFGDRGHPDRWRKALAQVRWEGRMEEILPGVYIDGAHNISAIRAFCASIPRDGRGTSILFSAMKDKDYREMIACLCAETDPDQYVVTRIPGSRGADPEELGRIFQEHTYRPVITTGSVSQALSYVLAHRGEGRVYCIGSLYLAGMIKEWIGEDR